MLDENNVLCLDAAQFVRFSLIGDGKLLDNRGTSSGASYVQLYNGRAIIKAATGNGKSVVSVQMENMQTAFINIGK